MSDLMRENEDGVSVMQWLRSAYDQDWKNLLERLKPKMGGLDPRWVPGWDVYGGGGVHCMWAGQGSRVGVQCGVRGPSM